MITPAQSPNPYSDREFINKDNIINEADYIMTPSSSAVEEIKQDSDSIKSERKEIEEFVNRSLSNSSFSNYHSEDDDQV